MKIGVHFGAGVPQSGGQFTFQRGVSEALAELAPKSRHSFVVGGTPNLLISPSANVHIIPFNRSLPARVLSRLYRNGSAARNTLLRRNGESPEFLEARPFIKRGVDMMWYVGPFCFTMEIPYVYTLLDLQHLIQPYFPEVSSNGIWHARQSHYATALRRASRIIVSTKVGKEEIERFYQVPGERIDVLPYAAPRYKLPIAPTDWVLEKYDLCPGYLFYPAQFWPQKNHVGVLRAMQLLRDRWGIGVSAVFVGSDKGNRAYVERVVADLGLGSQVRILGFVSAEDVTALYRHALALTMPTLVGPDNIPSLEAFALGCPVVTSNLAGFEEQLGEAALLVNPMDENAIAGAIKRLREDDALRQRLIERGIEWTRRWSWSDYVKGVFSILDKMEPIRRTWPSSSESAPNATA